MSQSHSMLFAALVLGGCVVTPGAGDVADPDTAPLGDVQQAYGVGPGEGPPLDPECPNGGNHTVHNPGFPAHERGTCAEGGGFGIDDAVVACGGRVKYYSASCDDFAASRPYQPENERAWTVYVGCCVNGRGPGPGPRGPGYDPGPIGPGPVFPGPELGPRPIGPGPVFPGPAVGPVPVEGPSDDGAPPRRSPPLPQTPGMGDHQGRPGHGANPTPYKPPT